MAVAARLSRIVLLVRGSEGIVSAVNFYQKAVGLHVLRVTEDWAELSTGSTTTTANNNNNSNNNSNNNNNRHDGDGGGITLSLQAVTTANEAQLSMGYSPWLMFTVNCMDETVAACIQAGAYLDGPIQYPAHGTVALIRSPDHHMIGLYEPAQSAVPKGCCKHAPRLKLSSTTNQR